MAKYRQSVVWLVVAACAVPTLQAQVADAPAVRLDLWPQATVGGPAATTQHVSPLLDSALAVGARHGAAQARRARLGESRANVQTSASKPFWTRTKLLVVGAAAVIVAAIVVAEMRRTCREQGPACFD